MLVGIIHWWPTPVGVSGLLVHVSYLRGHFTHEIESLWRDHFKLSDRWKKVELVQVRSNYTWGTNRVCECKMDVKSTCRRMDHVSWVTWTMFKNHLLEVGLTQNRETVALRMLTNCWFILSYHVWRPACLEIHWNSIWLRAQSHMTLKYTRGGVTTLHDFLEVSWDSLWTLSFGLPQLTGYSSWLMCEVALTDLEVTKSVVAPGSNNQQTVY